MWWNVSLPCVCMAVFAALPARALPPEPPVKLDPAQKHLFLDDTAVQEMHGLSRTMHAPEKRGAVIRPDIRSDGSRVQTYSTSPMWVPDEGVYKMVYMAFPMEDHSQIGAALAISKDGVHWEKPELGQEVKVRGSTKNNRIFVDRDLHWGDNALWNVVYDPDDADPSRRYKGLLGAIGRTPVVSADCIHWKKLNVPKIPSSDTSTLTYDRKRKQFLAFLKSSNKYGRAASISISKDFEHWSAPRPCFGADDKDQIMAPDVIRSVVNDPGMSHPLFVDPDPATGWKPPDRHIPTWRAECYSFAAFPYEGLYIGLPMMYYPTGEDLPQRNNTDGFQTIQLVMSHDLVTWQRLGDRAAFIGPSRADRGLVGVFDRGEITAPGQPLEVGDELWFYYTGFKSREVLYSLNVDGTPRDQATLSESEKKDLADGWSAICLAVLRRDGFISIDAGDQGGELLTKPIRCGGKNLYVNLNADEGGQLQVEALDNNGRPIPGFTLSECQSVTGNHVRQIVNWNGQPNLSPLTEKDVRLRFRLKNVHLYAFWTE